MSLIGCSVYFDVDHKNKIVFNFINEKKMISTETIAEQFDELGSEPSGAILERCLFIVLFIKAKLNAK